MLSDEPDNLSTLRGLMYSLYRMQDYDTALSLADRIASKKDPLFSPEATLLKGDIHWRRNEDKKAIYTYGSIRTEYETMARRRSKRIAALSYQGVTQTPPNATVQTGKSVRELFRSVLVEPKDAAEKMAALSICLQEEPDIWLAALLAGELLHREKAWQLSNQYFHSAVTQLEKLAVSDETASPMPLTQQQYQDLALEGRRLIGINAYHQQDYETALNAFSAIAKNEALPLGTILKAEEWQQRCRWAQLHRQRLINQLP